MPEQTPGTDTATETILLVEDERAVRQMTSLMLRRFGFRVLVASSGPEAMGIWAEEKDTVDLLLSDLVMPEQMSGFDLAKRLRRERPGLKVVFVSGYSPEIERLDCREGETAFLPKPFDVYTLGKVVRSLLDA